MFQLRFCSESFTPIIQKCICSWWLVKGLAFLLATSSSPNPLIHGHPWLHHGAAGEAASYQLQWSRTSPDLGFCTCAVHTLSLWAHRFIPGALASSHVPKMISSLMAYIIPNVGGWLEDLVGADEHVRKNRLQRIKCGTGIILKCCMDLKGWIAFYI